MNVITDYMIVIRLALADWERSACPSAAPRICGFPWNPEVT